MTFPRSSLVGLNPVAIGASNDAFMALNLGLDRLNRLQLMYVRGLAFHVVNVQRRMMGGVTAVDAPGARLKIRKPLLYEFAVLIGRQVYVLPVARLQKSVLAPGTTLISSRLRSLWPGLGDCIEWQGALNHGGYGVFTHRASGVKKKLAHRMSLEMDGVELPHGMVVDHLCRNRKCVNPHHLEVVTNEENLRRGAGYRLRNGMDNSCINGHEYTLKNTYSNPNKPGDIRCMECARTRDRERSRKKAS